MVRKKYVLTGFLLLFLLGCIKVNEYGIPERISSKKALNIPDTIYNKIDTLSLYKSVNYKIRGEFFKNNQVAIIRFYSKGKLNYFIGNETINIEYFNPKRGKQGSYYIKKNKILMNVYSSGEGFGFGSKGELSFNNDTIIYKEDENHYEYYVKMKNIPLEWLDYEPDW